MWASCVYWNWNVWTSTAHTTFTAASSSSTRTTIHGGQQTQKKVDVPCCCMHRRNLTTTFEEGRIRTCLRPRFSALEIVLRQSARTDIRTIWTVERYGDQVGRWRKRGTRKERDRQQTEEYWWAKCMLFQKHIVDCMYSKQSFRVVQLDAVMASVSKHREATHGHPIEPYPTVHPPRISPPSNSNISCPHLATCCLDLLRLCWYDNDRLRLLLLGSNSKTLVRFEESLCEEDAPQQPRWAAVSVCVKKRDGRRRRPLSLTTQVAVRNALLGTAQSFTAVYRVIGYEPIRFLPSY